MFDFKLNRYYKEHAKEESLNFLPANDFKNKAQQSIDAKTEALYNYLFDIAQKASLDGKFNMFIRQNDDIALIFKNKHIRSCIIKTFKEQGFKIKVVTGKEAYVFISW